MNKPLQATASLMGQYRVANGVAAQEPTRIATRGSFFNIFILTEF